ncbi:hypothetical protein CEUSTIGMA_g9546.t1 [Chlamydomonas eustigma]|uniref:Uncharacterized protein n=1 Tax=Chlamydomonas eustigma TaxID=1157962 RepID=A0A250XGB9_9CHLO|nr:hypothetical protein CEUSTIGMA_g9546.t1 [Chlamydomonas eustigma]|eukprot:GAX82118.1 hypothetical protein CEUSTIGMA_g9546.t1 [Chlamydomonas eustigma]
MTEAEKTKKRKKEKVAKEVDGDRPTASRGRNYTLSLAVASSVVGNVRNISNAASVAAQIARAAVAGLVDEIVVYDDERGASESTSSFLSLALQYLETPPYLRTVLCPLEATWQTALQKLGAIGAPHHLGQTEWMPYREGVVLKSSSQTTQIEGGHAFIDAGIDRMVYVPMHLPVMARVTLFLGDQPTSKFVSEYSETMIIAEVVSAMTPRMKHGLYNGFVIRVATSLHAVMKECPYKSGYDLTIGTSVRGVQRGHADLVLPRFSHGLVLFGGMYRGLADIMQYETDFAGKNPEDLFNIFLNICPSQGCKSLRTEDAVLLAIGYLRPALLHYGGDKGNIQC